MPGRCSSAPPRLAKRADHEHVDCGDAVIWFRRELRQCEEGVFERRGRCLPTLAWRTSMPGLRRSPRRRGASQSRLARLHRRIRSRISSLLLGRPGQRDRHCQWIREPLRGQRRHRFDPTKVSKTSGDDSRDNGNSRHAFSGRRNTPAPASPGTAWTQNRRSGGNPRISACDQRLGSEPANG